MKLLNLDNQALIVKDFLDQKLFDQIKNINFQTETDSHDDWNDNLKRIEKSNTLNKVKLTNHIYFEEMKKGEKQIKSQNEILKKVRDAIFNSKLFPISLSSQNYDFVLNYYEYQKGSGINWHEDGHATLNFSLYIHDDWNCDWGGETLIDTNRGLPLVSQCNPNTIVCIKTKVPHKVCPVIANKKRRVLQGRYTNFN